MKNFKNISLFTFAFITSAFMYGSVSQDSEFREETTDKWIYNKTVSTQKHGSMYTSIFGKHPNGLSITDNTSEDLLSNRVTRKRVETATENGVSIITTQTWVSRNPSYVTWLNGALIVGAIAGTILGAATIGALGNVGASGLQAYGNIGSSVVDASGNIVASGLQNPTSAAAFGSAFGNAAGQQLNNSEEGQKFMQALNVEIARKQAEQNN